MLKTWYNTDVQTVAGMLAVSDEKIREWSNGQVTSTYVDALDEGETKGSMVDEEIFGKAGTKSISMGHIELPVPVLNIQYLYGARPILAKIMNMSRKDITKLAHCILSVVTDPKDSGLTYGQVVTEKEVQEHPEAVYETGGAAIRELLKIKGIPESGFILNCIPVLPIDLRVKEEDGKFFSYQVQMLYDRLLMRVNRFKRLAEIAAPEIILKNETRMLQEYVDRLINNGAYGYPFMAYDGTVAASLDEMFHIISDISYQPRKLKDYKKSGLVDKAKFHELYAGLKKYMEEEEEPPYTDFDENGNIAYQNEGGRLEEEIKKVLLPLVESVIDDNFSDYKEAYHEDMVANALTKGLDFSAYKEDDDLEDFFIRGIFYRIDNYIQKRSMYKEAE